MSNIIQGNPTKSFFIDMITRDISIKDAIVDLLDNSIDGANRLNGDNYSGSYINITINKDVFIVEDNCGGFSIETAQQYAFRFGRPEDAPDTLGSVGRFGIGMKRALFKMGRMFTIESKTSNSHFKVGVDVEEWKSKQKSVTYSNGEREYIDDWSFLYEQITSDGNLNNNGTYICVSNLYPEVSNMYCDEQFLNSLCSEIEVLLNFSLEKNIKISVNGRELVKKGIELIFDENTSTPYIEEGSKDGVNYKIVAGLGNIGDPSISGWYVYCNDRMIVDADKSVVTGWGTTIPKWHINHVMFRGVVFIDSQDTIKLPLTTTKKGIDTASEIYKLILSRMTLAAQNVIPFLRDVAKLSEANEYRQSLVDDSNKKSIVSLRSIAPFEDSYCCFRSPDLDYENIIINNNETRISYSVPKRIAEIAKHHAGVNSNKDLGALTFDYYMKMEEIDYE